MVQRESKGKKVKTKRKCIEPIKFFLLLLRKNNRRRWRQQPGSAAAAVEAGQCSTSHLFTSACCRNVIGGLADLGDQVALACQC